MSSLVSTQQQNKVATRHGEHAKLLSFHGPYHDLVLNYLDLESFAQFYCALGKPKTQYAPFHNALRVELEGMIPCCKALKAFQCDTAVWRDLSTSLPSVQEMVHLRRKYTLCEYQELLERLFCECCYRLPLRCAALQVIPFVRQSERRSEEIFWQGMNAYQNVCEQFRKIHRKDGMVIAYRFAVDRLQQVQSNMNDNATEYEYSLRTHLPLLTLVACSGTDDYHDTLAEKKRLCGEYISLATLMVKNGFNIHQTWDDQEHNVLMLACMFMKADYEASPDGITIIDENKNHIYNFFDIVIDKMVDHLDEKDAIGATALIIAAYTQNLYAFYRLWNHPKVNVLQTDGNGKTAMTILCTHLKPEHVALLFLRDERVAFTRGHCHLKL